MNAHAAGATSPQARFLIAAYARADMWRKAIPRFTMMAAADTQLSASDCVNIVAAAWSLWLTLACGLRTWSMWIVCTKLIANTMSILWNGYTMSMESASSVPPIRRQRRAAKAYRTQHARKLRKGFRSSGCRGNMKQGRGCGGNDCGRAPAGGDCAGVAAHVGQRDCRPQAAPIHEVFVIGAGAVDGQRWNIDSEHDCDWGSTVVVYAQSV